jgi:predicted type IV restriction endonuclease
LQINDENKTTFKIETVDDFLNYKEELIEVAKQFDKTNSMIS